MGQYEVVTNKIVAMMEAGVRPWSQGWAGGGRGGRPYRVTGEAYRGINTLWLYVAGIERGFTSPYWMTFKGAQELGGQVRRGAKSEPAFYAGAMTKEVENKRGEAEDKTIRFMKSYRVFNACEVDGLPARFFPAEVPNIQTDQPIPEIDEWIRNTGARCEYGGGRAYYQPAGDVVRMPEFCRFKSAADFYSVHFHELAHWTGEKARLCRVMSQEKQAYAAEELIAEMAAAFLCFDHRLDAEPREDHAAYIASWIKWLRHDPRAIFTAAAQAERAVGFLHDKQPKVANAAA